MFTVHESCCQPRVVAAAKHVTKTHECLASMSVFESDQVLLQLTTNVVTDPQIDLLDVYK